MERTDRSGYTKGVQIGISGVVVDLDTGRAPSWQIDVSWRLVIGNFIASVAGADTVLTDPQGAFSGVVEFPDEQVARLTENAIFELTVRTGLPAAARASRVSIASFLPFTEPNGRARGQHIIEDARLLAAGLQLTCHLGACTSHPINVTAPDIPELANVTQLAVVVLDRAEDNPPVSVGGAIVRTRLAAATARRGSAAEPFRALLTIPRDEFAGVDFWVRVAGGARASRVLARTRVQPRTSPDGAVFESAFLLRAIDEKILLGTILAGVPSSGHARGYTYRDVMLRLEGDPQQIRVTGYVGQGAAWDHAREWIRIGRFEAVYTLSFLEPTEQAFAVAEQSSLVRFTTAEFHFDADTFTELDGESPVDVAVADFLAPIIEREIVMRLVDKVQEQVDRELRAVRDRLAETFPTDVDAVMDEVRLAYSIQPRSLTIDIEGIRIQALIAMFHWAAGLMTVATCPGVQALAAMPHPPRARAIVPFRKLERRLARPELARWRTHLQVHGRELAAAFAKHRHLAAIAAQLVAELGPALEDPAIPIGDNHVVRTRQLLHSVAREASDELRAVLREAEAIADRAAGKQLAELFAPPARHGDA